MRTVLHVDCNNFYASVECLYNPQLRGKPVAVCGDLEARHGIVLAKNDAAKACGICTGNPIWLAKRLCPELVVVPPHYDRYLQMSQLTREIYSEYTDRVEPYGLDECWMDVSTLTDGPETGKSKADELRKRIRFELGITVSVGISFNKVFAKLGSDLKKPDATTIIPADGWRHIVWPLPATELLYVGPQTGKLLHKYCIKTIGDLAAVPPATIHAWLGKCGIVLLSYAKGLDQSPVAHIGETPPVKSIGNSTTMPCDLADGDKLRIILYILSESVGERLREQGLQCSTIQVSFRKPDLTWYERQVKLPSPTCNSQTIFHHAYRLYQNNVPGLLRSVGVRACGLDHWSNIQTSLFDEVIHAQKLDNLDSAIDGIRRRFGRDSVRRGIMLADRDLAALDPRTDHPNMPRHI